MHPGLRAAWLGFSKALASIVAACWLLLAAPMFAVSPTHTAMELKEDYLQACRCITNEYVFLERKTGKSPGQFMKECEARAEQVDWNQGFKLFYREMLRLRAMFPDGHFDVVLDEDHQFTDTSQYLGFTLTVDKHNRVRVARVVAPALQGQLAVGDEILSWNGKPVQEALAEVGKQFPQSTPAATAEISARLLTLDIENQPIREFYPSVVFTFHREGEPSTRSLKATWENRILTAKPDRSSENTRVYCTHNGYPSTESLPRDITMLGMSLGYYMRTIDGKVFTIVHPRAFLRWDSDTISTLMASINAQAPDYLVIDLHDASGGDLKLCTLLLQAVNGYDKDYCTGHSKTWYLKDESIWKGKLLVRCNAHTGSCGDWFTNQLKVSKRAILFGMPTAGRTATYDEFTLSYTKTQLLVPTEEGLFGKERKSMEGVSIIPDYVYDLFDGSIEDQLADLLKKLAK